MLDKSKLSLELIKFLNDRNIPEEDWEDYLRRNSTTINVSEFPVVDSSFTQGTMDEISLLSAINNKPLMTLYETNIMGVTNIGSEKGNTLLRFGQKRKSPYYKLEYFREFNGQEDVIKETLISPDKDNVISYYTIFNIAGETYGLTATTQNDDISGFKWNLNCGVIPFVIARFKAFKDKGITFTNDNINTLIDEYNKNIKPKTRARIDK